MRAIFQLKNKLVNALTSNNESNTSQSNIGEISSTFDILAKDSMSLSIFNKFVLNFENIDNIETLKTCKVLKISSSYTAEDIKSKLNKLNNQQCPNLFIFVIEVESLTKSKIIDLQSCFLELFQTRPIILQISSKNGNSTNIYFKKEESNFVEILPSNRTDQSFEDFSTFMQQFLSQKFTNFEELMLEKLPTVNESSQIIRFLRALKMSKNFFKQLILKCSSEGTKQDLLATIDAPFEGDGRILNCDVENWIKNTIMVRQSQNSLRNKEKPIQSILFAAVTSANMEVLDYLISHCSYLIQQLPFDHQVQITTAAFASQQFDVLCDLIKLCDFPFPENFKSEPIVNERFNQIVNERKQFFEAVDLDELNTAELAKFINENRNLNIVYTFSNESTLFHALITGHYRAYFHLKSQGFESREFDEINEVLEGDELRKANKIATLQRSLNVNNSALDILNPVYLLKTRSSIHNRKTRSEDEAIYNELIRKWYEKIYNSRFGSLLLRVASMCPKLRIVFDFESDSVENVSLQSKYTQGSMFPGSKRIFVGAKLAGVNRNQQIKGIIAHELCHYVMTLTYENNEEPYPNFDKERKQIFSEIVEAIDKWSLTKSKDPNDECEDIISGVYRFYGKKDWIAELIVRVPQIMAHYDNNPGKIGELEVLYERLFQYFERFVVPDMQSLDLQERGKIRNLNKNFKLFSTISKLNLEFQSSKHINSIYSSRVTVVLANIPMFLYSELYKLVRERHGNLKDACNIFVSYKMLNDDEILDNYSEIISKTTGLNVIVDCAGKNGIDLVKIGCNESNTFTFICSKKEQYNKVVAGLKDLNISPSLLSSTIYSWHDLSQKSQKSLLQIEINFQNCKIKFFDILWNKKGKPSAEDDARICRDFADIADYELLNLLIENKELSIQTTLANERIDENFDIIFRDRKFVKKVNNKLPVQILQKNLLASTKKESFVLISDIAGTGKSWAIKVITKMLRTQNPTKWITYVNLQQLMKAFEAQKKTELNFLKFMIEKVFEFENIFESEMFRYLYKNGQVCILFDGFDEISPDYAEVVKKLVDTFERSNGNQLWIATRDFFEVDLQKHLKLDISYKLEDFKDEDGIDLIIRNCVLTNLRLNKVKIEDDFDKQVKNHPKYQIYLQAAIKLHQKVSSWTLKSIGLPQLYKMIGDVLIEFEDSPNDLTEFTLYDKFIDHLYKRWYSEKGKLREQKSIENQKEDMNYRELHEFCAMKSLLPDNSYFCDLELDKRNWNDVEIVGCGILNKKTEDGDEFLFPHETYREFFAASFIIRILKKKPRQIDLDVLKYLIKFSSNSKYGVIQMFLLHGFKDIKALPNNNMMIVSTNVPQLLKINIYQHIQKECKNEKIFVIQDDIFSNTLCEEFGDDFKKNSNLKAIVKPSVNFKEQLKKLTENNSVAIIVIVPNEERGIQLCTILQYFKFNPEFMDLRYDWNDLTNESQNSLLQDEISIDGHTKVTLSELLTGEIGNNIVTKDPANFSEQIDDNIMSIIANNSQIKVNKSLKYDMEFKPFQLLFQPRSFIKKINLTMDACAMDNQASDTIELSQDQLLSDVENKKCVLISDVAGKGKTMAVQQLTNILRSRFPNKWVTYINLSFSLNDFANNSTLHEFSTLCIENLFKTESKLKIKECFTSRYNSGNVIFILDGYDEVAHENVYTNNQFFYQIFTNLLKSFKFNRGNQLWIVTKDNFEEKLMKEIEVDAVYKMGNFSNDNGIKLIAKYNILKNLKVKNDVELNGKFQEIIKTTNDLEDHQKIANQYPQKSFNKQEIKVNMRGI